MICSFIAMQKHSPHVSSPQGLAAPTSLSKAPLSAVDVCATWDGANAATEANVAASMADFMVVIIVVVYVWERV